MKSHLFTLLVIIVLAIGSCKKSEGDLSPSGIDDTYHVPQGNNAFDQTIVNYYQKYGSYILYKFTEKDALWTPTGYKSGFDVAQANPEYVAAQLDLLDKSLFSLYPTNFLKQFLPVKILLCSKVDSNYVTYTFNPYQEVAAKKKIPGYYSYDNFTVNYGDASLNTMTAVEKLAFLARLNLVFFQSINERGLIKPSTEFINSADYITSSTSQAIAYSKGIISLYYSTSSTSDWNAFVIAMVSLSEADLNRSVANTNTSAVGILNPAKDSKGLIRKRYNIVRNFFIDNYQLDLQKIGNAARGI